MCNIASQSHYHEKGSSPSVSGNSAAHSTAVLALTLTYQTVIWADLRRSLYPLPGRSLLTLKSYDCGAVGGCVRAPKEDTEGEGEKREKEVKGEMEREGAKREKVKGETESEGEKRQTEAEGEKEREGE